MEYPTPSYLSEAKPWGDRAEKLAPNPKLWAIIKAANPKFDPTALTSNRVLSLDPGQTTGVAFLMSGTIYLGQWDTQPGTLGESYLHLLAFIEQFQPSHLRYEDYKVYGWKAQDHSFASLHTPQWIGAIEVAAFVSGTPNSKKMAQQAKAFWTDAKLKLVGCYSPGMKHARDATRHLLYYLCNPVGDE